MKRFKYAALSVLFIVGFTGCGESPTGQSVDTAAGLDYNPTPTLSKAITTGPADVLIQVTDAGVPAADLTLTLAPSIAGVADAESVAEVTDANGEAAISVVSAGYYTAVATDASANVVGRWGSIPVNRGNANAITLPIGGQPVVHPRGPRLNVMTRNLYLGADVNRLLAPADPSVPLPVIAAQTWGVVQQTNFPERAAAIADEIKRTRPHLIGLQECALYRIQNPGDVLVGNPVPATDVALDMLDVLLDELAARGLHYTAVAISEGIDIELPMVTGATPEGEPTFGDIRLTDREVILARNGVQIGDVVEQQYQAAVPVSLSGIDITIPRAYASAEATYAGRTIRFVTTHLETGSIPQVQSLQGAELAATVVADPLPVVLVGDFNSDANGTTTDTYLDLVGSGLVDAYGTANPGQPGFTGSQEEDLLTSPSALNRRIDLVFVREADGILPLWADIVGDEESDRTPSGLWPSDHAGVAASVVLPTLAPF